MDVLLDGARIANDWFYINTNGELIIDNIIFVTSKYIDIIDEAKKNRNIFLITNSETANDYNIENVNIINYDKYIISEIEYNEKMKEYAKHGWKVGKNGNSVFNENIEQYILYFDYKKGA